MLFFAFTGLTLNRPEIYVAKPDVKEWFIEVPDSFVNDLRSDKKSFESNVLAWSRQEGRLKGIPSPIRSFIQFDGDDLEVGEVELDFKGPGYDASVFIDLEANEAEFRVVDYGTVAWLNDLHKGRNTGAAWHLFIDVASIVMLLFVVTGFILVFPRKKRLLWQLSGSHLAPS
ncbi:putative membrane protein [Vibrio astriarenae]|nr:putative membrane protein [Vibrio sp. C7]